MNIRRHMVRLPYHAPPRRLHPTTTFGRRMLNLNYSPVISPSIPVSSPSSLNGDYSPLVRGLSTSSVQSLAELFIGGRTSSASSVQLAQGEVEVVKEEGLRHSSATLEARRYKTEEFATQLLACIKTLHVPSWNASDLTPQGIKIQKVSGSMTNAVFFVSYPQSSQKVHTLLLRIYGPSSGSLISRPRELHTLHILSSKYNIGPKVYGTFENGRLEEYFESTTLTAADLRDSTISAWIGSRMAELHSVDVEVIAETSPETRGEGNGWDITAKINVNSWLPLARDVLALPPVSVSLREELNLDLFEKQWKAYTRWLQTVDDVHGASHRVFAHNDAQYGNLLRRTDNSKNLAPHHQIIVVDFEYAGPNPATFDIANHFHEWTADYHGATPHLLDPSRYPSLEERKVFYASYLRQANPSVSNCKLQDTMSLLDDQVRYWSPATHAMWTIWAIVQARDDLENGVSEPEFEYLAYSQCRMAGFRREIERLGIEV